MQPDIRRANIAGFGPVWTLPINAAMFVLVVTSLGIAIVSLPVALVVFWVLLQTAAYVLAPGSSHEWVLLTAGLLALLTASGVSYLLQDALMLFSNSRARRLLRSKAERVRAGSLPQQSYFVQFESGGSWPRTAPRPDDIGWLTIEPHKLSFVGDRFFIDIPKAGVRAVRRGPKILRLTSPACIDIIVATGAKGDGRLRLVPRMADRLADAPATLAQIDKTLSDWHSAPAPTSP